MADDPARTQNQGSIYMRLEPLGERDQFELMNHVRSSILPALDVEGLRTGVRPVATFGGGGNQNAEIQFTIKGPDLEQLERYGTAVAEAARKQPGLVDVDTSLNVGKPELSVHIDRLKDVGVQTLTPPKRCDCWSAATRSRRTTRGASSTRCPSGRAPATAPTPRRSAV